MDIENLIKDYKNRNLKVSDILNKYNISQRSLNSIIKENNIESRRKIFSNEELNTIKDKFLIGISIKDISIDLGVRRESIWRALNKMGIDTTKKNIISENIDEIKQLYEEGYPIMEISNKLDIKYKSLLGGMYRYIKGTRRLRIEDATLNKILEELEQKNMTQKDLAEKYNVSTAFIYMHKRNI